MGEPEASRGDGVDAGRVLVTGAAGFIGSHLCERLVGEGREVVGVDRFSPYYDPEIKRGNLNGLLDSDRFELVAGSLAELELERLLDGVETIYHLAAQPGVRASWGSEFHVYLAENVQATQALLEALKDREIAKLVYASSSSIYGDAGRYPTPETELPRPVSPYGVTKLAAEHLCGLYWSAFGVPATSVRYFTIFGPRQRPDMAFQRFIGAALRSEPVKIYGDGAQSRDFTYVSDAVAATIAAARSGRPGQAYNVAGGTQATVLEVLTVIERLAGTTIEREHLPAVPGDARKTGAATALARDELGFTPEVGLEEGLARQLESQRGAAASPTG